MKILVAVKQVAVLDEEFELIDDGAGVDADSLEWEVNEWDTFSVEEALQIREAAGGDGDEVVVVTVGDDDAEDALLSGLAMGADRAVRVWDESLENADPLTVARILASVAERESPDLILCGVQSSDAVNGATGIALAGYLDVTHVAVVKKIELDAGTATATVDRELEGGLVEMLRVRLPALLTVQTGINEPRYATLRAIKQARQKPLEVCGLDELGLEASELDGVAGARRRGLAPPARGEEAEMLNGSAAAVAARIVEIVEERMKG